MENKEIDSIDNAHFTACNVGWQDGEEYYVCGGESSDSRMHVHVCVHENLKDDWNGEYIRGTKDFSICSLVLFPDKRSYSIANVRFEDTYNNEKHPDFYNHVKKCLDWLNEWYIKNIMRNADYVMDAYIHAQHGKPSKPDREKYLSWIGIVRQGVAYQSKETE